MSTMAKRHTKEREQRRQNYSLEKFVYESSLAKSAGELERLWFNFIRLNLGAVGCRASLYPCNATEKNSSLVEIANFSELSNVQSWIEYYGEQGFHRYDPCFLKGIQDPGTWLMSEAIREYASPDADRVICESRNFGSLASGICVDLWVGPNMMVGGGIVIPSCDIYMDRMVKRMLETSLYTFYASLEELIDLPESRGESEISLTPRERDVLCLIALGKRKDEIADSLCVTISTVKRHCENASLKLGANNMASTVARAISRGFIHI